MKLERGDVVFWLPCAEEKAQLAVVVAVGWKRSLVWDVPYEYALLDFGKTRLGYVGRFAPQAVKVGAL